MLRHLRMSVRLGQTSRRAMSAATGVMRLIMLPLIAATGIVRLIMSVITATSIVRLTLLRSIVVTNIRGLIMPPIIEAMVVMGLTQLRPIIEATTVGDRGARLLSTPCRNIQHRRTQLRLRTPHRNVRRPNTRLMKKHGLSPRGSATRSRRARRGC